MDILNTICDDVNCDMNSNDVNCIKYWLNSFFVQINDVIASITSFICTNSLDCICWFSDIYISQGSVATRFRYGGIFNDNFIANFPESVSVEEF